ncbi:MAG: hypothetical protein ACYTDX_00685 [Planctomycetota bacterium]
MPKYQMGMGGNIPDTYSGIPHAWLIGADGNVVFKGHPSRISKKDIIAELKKIKKASPDQQEAQASRSAAFAEKLVEEKKYLRAQEVLTRVSKEFKKTETGMKAAETLKEWKKDKAISAEIKAQQLLMKMMKLESNLDRPLEKMKKKDIKVARVRLESFIKKNKDNAPGAAAIAEKWAMRLQ